MANPTEVIYLKPCPFCGSKYAPEIMDTEEMGKAGNGQCVCCDYMEGGCGATGGFRPTAKDAREKWNQRA